MIHYHGGPLTPATVAWKVWRARHAMVSFQAPSQIEIAAAVSQSFVLDNGAFSAWRAGEPIVDWAPYYGWAAKWLRHPGCDFAIIPDVIDGSEADNDVLIAQWPHGQRGVPVWHLHESIDRLLCLAAHWPRVAMGSSGQYADIGTDLWWARMGEALSSLQDDDDFLPCKLHGLRMLNPKVVCRLPLSSGDSTNIAQNIGIDQAWKGPYIPKSKETRGMVLAERIEETNSAPIWRELTQGNVDWVAQALAANT